MSKRFLGKLFRFAAMNSFIIFLAANSVNSTCVLGHHQPTAPAAAKKLRKF